MNVNEGPLLLLDASDRIVFAADVAGEPVVARYDLDGNSEASFNGGAAFRQYSDGNEIRDFVPLASEFDSEGRLVVCGSANGGGQEQMFVMRVWP